jgi:hypothetical protein
MESYKRTYVAVNADFRADGLILPRVITWYDDLKYEIDRVIRVEPAAARKAGSSGDRYTIMVHGKQTYLFFERSTNLTGPNIGRWFVEERISS